MTIDSRRNFIKLALTSMAGLGWLPHVRAGSAPMTSDVVIIGAGMSGLSAAKDLVAKGKSVILLEAQSSIGGRIVTDRSLGLPLDLGASWIHGINRNPISAIANSLNISTFPTNYDSIQRYDFDGRAITDAEDSLVDANYDTLMSGISRAQRQAKTDKSLGSAINAALSVRTYSPFEQRAIQYSINTDIEHDYAADTSRMSLKYWDQDSGFSGKDVIIKQGYSQITDYLAVGLDVRLSTLVQEINYGGSNVTIKTNNGTFSAKKVILTVPLGVLKAGAIKFTPALPAGYSAAISRLGMGVLNKTYLRFPYRFWDNQEQLLGYIGLERGRWAEWYDFQRITNQPILLGFNAGSFASTLEAYSDAQTVSSAMSVLRAIYGASVPDPVGYKITRWGKNPFSFGSYSFVGLGSSPRDCDTLASPVNSKLIFAGEHTIKKYIGTAHGAYLSGLNASAKV